MKTKLTALFIVVFFVFSLISCDKNELDGEIGGKQSEFGEVGNKIEFGFMQGLSNTQVIVSDLQDGVSTFTCKTTSSNSNYIDILATVSAALIPGTVNISGNTVEAQIKMKITDQGAQLVFNDGSRLTLVDYGAKVGNKYSVTVDGKKLECEVTERSTEDDFYWGGMYIKVIKVKAKSIVPGVKDVFMVYNHRFGWVGADVVFEDGSTKSLVAYC